VGIGEVGVVVDPDGATGPGVAVGVPTGTVAGRSRPAVAARARPSHDGGETSVRSMVAYANPAVTDSVPFSVGRS
jgi:hypothetical protein